MVKVFVCINPFQCHKKKKFLHLPDCGDEMQRVLRNQVICPRAECLSEALLHVLFCKLGEQRLHE